VLPYRILARKRSGDSLSPAEIRAFVEGATKGEWSEAQLGAFLMAVAIRGLSFEETRVLTEAMTASGETWQLSLDRPFTCDKHSTGGVGDKVSLVFSPLVATHGLPVAKLTGRGLGHTGGTADKLESIPGFDLDLDRDRCLRLLDEVGIAVGIATGAVAPADKVLYRIRDQTATIESLPLIAASVLSKKLAVGAGALVFDVKTGAGAFLSDPREAGGLARLMVAAGNELGCKTSAWVTDMSQPLGRWVGHAAEVREALTTLEGDGPEDLTRLSATLAREALSLHGWDVSLEELTGTLRSGRARETFLRWAEAQGANAAWTRDPVLELAPEEIVVTAARSGWLASVDTRQLGLLLVEAGGGRARAGDAIDHGVALHYRTRLGSRLEAGDELARVYVRTPGRASANRFRGCFAIEEHRVEPPELLREQVKG